MAMKKRKNIDVFVGTLADNTDEFNMHWSAKLSPAERVDAACERAIQYHLMKGTDLDARRLDRTIRVIRKT